MLSICPHCVRTLGTDYKEFGESFQIEHHSELMARLQDKLPQPVGAREKTVFHDPCYLGRYRGVLDEPREVIGRYGDAVEAERSRERSLFLGEEKGKRVNVERATELAGTGAAMVGTACPFCQTMFRDAFGTMTQPPPKLLDIAQIAAASLPGKRAVTAT